MKKSLLSVAVSLLSFVPGAYASFDFTTFLRPADSCDSDLGGSPLALYYLKEAKRVNTRRLYDQLAFDLIQSVSHGIVKEARENRISSRSLFHVPSIKELYKAGLLVEPVDGKVEIYQDTSNKQRWLPELLLRFLAKEMPLNQAARLMQKSSPDRPVNVILDGLLSAPHADYLSIVLSQLRHAESNSFIKSFAAQYRTGPHEGELKGKHLYTHKLDEPISEIRFASDKTLKLGNSETNGYLSIVGWTRTTYFRVANGLVNPISVQVFEKAIHSTFNEEEPLTPIDVRPEPVYMRFANADGQSVFESDTGGDLRQRSLKPKRDAILRAAGIEVDSERFDRDRAYRTALEQTFNQRTFRLSRNVPLEGSDWYLDALKLDQMGKFDPDKALVYTGLGGIAQVLADFGKTAQSGVRAAEWIERAPNVTLALGHLATYALSHDDIARREFVTLFNVFSLEHELGVQLSSDSKRILEHSKDDGEEQLKKGRPVLVMTVRNPKNLTGFAEYLVYANDIIYTASTRLERKGLLLVEPVRASTW